MKRKNKDSIEYVLSLNRIDNCLDFIVNLTNYIIQYYDDSIITDEMIRSHYDWCYDKTCDDFFLEGINYYDNDDLREYFYSFYYKQFYTKQTENDYDKSLEFFIKFWTKMLDIKINPSQNKIMIILAIYKYIDKSLMNIKNILNV